MRALEIGNAAEIKEKAAQKAYAASPMASRYCYEPECEPVARALYRALVKERPQTAQGIAGTVYRTLRKVAADMGMNPDMEVHKWTPAEQKRAGYGEQYRVSWEAGPYEWAIGASFAVMDATGKLCEPHYSFDLCFYPGED